MFPGAALDVLIEPAAGSLQSAFSASSSGDSDTGGHAQLFKNSDLACSPSYSGPTFSSLCSSLLSAHKPSLGSRQKADAQVKCCEVSHSVGFKSNLFSEVHSA